MEAEPTPCRPTNRFSRPSQTQPKRVDPANGDEEEVDARRIAQRQKQIDYGYNTDGFKNMVRLVQHDPRLRNGGVLPLQPPAATLKVSKKKWDVLSRKWRRALHMFDDVFIDGQDLEGDRTLEEVIAAQRLNWLAPKFKAAPRHFRSKVGADKIFAVRDLSIVPKKLPVELCMKPLLRCPSYFEDVSNVVPESASSLTRGSSNVSPTEAGIKIHVAPSPEAAMMSSCSPQGRSSSPGHAIPAARSTSPMQHQSPMNFLQSRISPSRSPSPPPYEDVHLMH